MTTRTVLIFTAGAIATPAALAGYDPGSDGSDGPAIFQGSVVVDLTQARTDPWDTPGTGNGVYDPDLWIVAFKYTNIHVEPGAIVTFIGHPSGAPVVWLAQGDVVIEGTIYVTGSGGAGTGGVPSFAIPGPGGFEGGRRGVTLNGFDSSPGMGPGGGDGPACSNGGGGGGGHNSSGNAGSNGSCNGAGGAGYSNGLIPTLIGGSGGGGGYSSAGGGQAGGAGGGGGAILIASASTISLNTGSRISANGGAGAIHSGGGSGGAIRLVAPRIAGNATGLTATGGGTVAGDPRGGNGADGRIRIECNTPELVGQSDPAYSFGGAPRPALSPATQPLLRVVSVDSVSAPADPCAGIGCTDVEIANLNPVVIQVEAFHFPVSPTTFQLEIFVIPAHGQRQRTVITSNPFTVCGDHQCATLTDITVPPGRNEIQLRATWTP